MTPPKVSVIIVSYNTCPQLVKCVRCLLEGEMDPNFQQIIVVDNDSKDDSVATLKRDFSQVEIIENGANLGFGVANNIGAKVAKGEWLLYLNSDAYAEPGAVRQLVEEAEQAGAVAAGGKLKNLDGSLQNSSANRLTLWALTCEQLGLEKAFRGSRLFDPYWNTQRMPSDTTPSYQVMGACLLARAFEAFDERFFLYCEDTDLCERLRRHGPIVYVPSAEFFHELGTSSRTNWWMSVARYNAGKELYFQLHFSKLHRLAAFLLNRLGALIRFVMWLLLTLATLGTQAKFRNRVGGFFKVLVAPVLGPSRPDSRR